MELIDQWRAHGLLDPSSEDAGEEYFNDLLRSSFFLDASYSRYGNLTDVRMHDLMHELALSISKSDTLTLGNCTTGNEIFNIQHLNIIPCEGFGGTVPIFVKDKAKALRTLFAENSDVIYDSFKFKSLRVLKLTGGNVKVLPASIGELKHMRYLDVSYSEITTLPKSITNLYNLQLLLMFECKLLEKVPKRLKNLVSLTHLIFSYEKQMPSDVACLTNLQRLSLFVLGPDRGGSIEALECLNELSFDLKISNLELVRDGEEAKKANLESKRKLDVLALVWSDERNYYDKNMFRPLEGSVNDNYNDESVLEGLQPFQGLKGLVIKNYLGEKFPSWLLTMKVTRSAGDCHTLNNLVGLKLKGCRRCEEIPTVGRLPLLRVVEIVGLENVKYMGDEFYGSNEASTSNGCILFPALKRLVIRSMKSLVEWKGPITFNAFPCLEGLHISKCPTLRNIPISHLSALVEFTMEHCDAFDELVFDNGQPLISLRSLHIQHCCNLSSFPSVHCLTSLRILTINNCGKLISLPRGLKLCSSLDFLGIWQCQELTSVPEDLQELQGLEFLGRVDFKSLPDQLQSFTFLKRLLILQFNGVEALPEWLCNLSSLEHLEIYHCENLKYLPSFTAIQGLSHLKELKIENCPLLTESCSEWYKIIHIPKIVIDEVVMQDS